MKSNKFTRRSFLEKSAVTTGMAAMGALGFKGSALAQNPGGEKLPREVWLASFSQEGVEADSPDAMVKKVMDHLQGLEPFSPDVVCLPEVFPFSNVTQETSLKEKITFSEEVLNRFSDYSKKNNCYTVCAVYMPADQGMMYNSAVVLDRQGKRAGIYYKIHPTEDEIRGGIKPGPLFQPVIRTDFGKIGIQICFDAEWDDGWAMYRKQGAEIIFFPSAFPAGRIVNTHAWKNKCVVVASTRKETSKICDITGEELAKTGYWNKQLCWAPVNLEKAFLHLWPFVERFPEIRNKYGRKVNIRVFDEEEWAIIESLSPEIFVKDILKEFDIKTYEELIGDSEKAQVQNRES